MLNVTVGFYRKIKRFNCMWRLNDGAICWCDPAWRMSVLLVKPCSMGTHWRCLIVKILLGEGLEVFRFFSCPEDVYYTLAWNEAGCPNFPSSNFVFPEEDYCPQIIFRCLMYLHHNLHPVRHINYFVFRHFYHLCLSNILACHHLHPYLYVYLF